MYLLHVQFNLNECRVVIAHWLSKTVPILINKLKIQQFEKFVIIMRQIFNILFVMQVALIFRDALINSTLVNYFALF